MYVSNIFVIVAYKLKVRVFDVDLTKLIEVNFIY